MDFAFFINNGIGINVKFFLSVVDICLTDQIVDEESRRRGRQLCDVQQQFPY